MQAAQREISSLRAEQRKDSKTVGFGPPDESGESSPQAEKFVARSLSRLRRNSTAEVLSPPEAPESTGTRRASILDTGDNAESGRRRSSVLVERRLKTNHRQSIFKSTDGNWQCQHRGSVLHAQQPVSLRHRLDMLLEEIGPEALSEGQNEDTASSMLAGAQAVATALGIVCHSVRQAVEEAEKLVFGNITMAAPDDQQDSAAMIKMWQRGTGSVSSEHGEDEFMDPQSRGRRMLSKTLRAKSKGNCRLSDAEAELAANTVGEALSALEQISTVDSLVLSGIDLGTRGAQWIADALESNTVLTMLDLSNNECLIPEKIARALERNGTLTSLNLCQNELGAEGSMCIAEALMQNCTLASLNLGSNNLLPQGADAIAQTLCQNCAFRASRRP
eukprot:gnl/TRDRNA2_/TRDRNA2_140406_c1_seq1.p1 gnl/TRDRNA2_/TRDRNA2_140406_c1~~gnl/TRDRNA2_/TRDRNA2_140406_c1_seq1.p1  ORF type:complete len:390 (+),score=57.15 gnl/TRDRNA2_/TRDRNA2_140406_c1_seq1:59-1228(+)